MPRFARVVVPSYPHHVTQRGNAQREVFFAPADRQVYLKLLKQYSRTYHLEILGYCLMTNHVHIVAVPEREDSLARTFREVHCRYAQYRNALESRTGHLWQNRYYSCACQPHRLGSVMRYVEMNPVRAGLAAAAADYAWSSAAIHLGADDPVGLVSLEAWRDAWTCEEWAQVLRDADEHEASIREATFSGRPLGSDAFLDRLEQELNRPLRRRRAGRRKLAEHAVSA